jgi:hypothetical protein
VFSLIQHQRVGEAAGPAPRVGDAAGLAAPGVTGSDEGAVPVGTPKPGVAGPLGPPGPVPAVVAVGSGGRVGSGASVA